VEEHTHELYESLRDVLVNTNKNLFPRVAGDLNARVWNIAVNPVLGRNGESPVGWSGRKLLEFVTDNELRIADTFFKYEDIHKLTWRVRSCR
jgi:hypothetical protein